MKNKEEISLPIRDLKKLTLFVLYKLSSVGDIKITEAGLVLSVLDVVEAMANDFGQKFIDDALNDEGVKFFYSETSDTKEELSKMNDEELANLSKLLLKFIKTNKA